MHQMWTSTSSRRPCFHTSDALKFVERVEYWNDGGGCTIETLAELMGNTPKVAFDHYGKEWGQHYQEPLWAAIGVGAKTKSPAAKPKRMTKRKKAR